MSPEQGKMLCMVFADTMKSETESTKKVIRAIPEDKKHYKPEEKARSAHELAWHIATAEVWFLDGVLAGEFSMSGEAAAPATVAEILDWYETNYSDRVNRLKELPAENLLKPIPFFGLMELPAV